MDYKLPMGAESRAGRKMPRTYLRAKDRYEQLLTVAADLVGQRGWAALGMMPLAEAAGVSRQLVYEHFADTSNLLVAVTRHLFERARATTRLIVATPADDMGSVIRRAYEVYLELPRAQRRALRSLAGDDEPDSPEVRHVRHLMRQEILGLWVPFVHQRTKLSEPLARALAWMLLTGTWGLTDLVEDGALTLAEAEHLLVTVVDGALSAMGQSRAPRAVHAPPVSRSGPRRRGPSRRAG